MTNTSDNPFLENFFRANGNHRGWERSYSYFREYFVDLESNFLEKLRNDIRMPLTGKKVVVVDGHPRAGKTWCTLRAISMLIEKHELDADACWTAGMDSLSLFTNRHNNLLSACENVTDSILSHPECNMFLLDDFVGTNKPRNFIDNVDPLKVMPFFQWDSNNPWIQSLPDRSVLVITSRALFLTLLDICIGATTRTDQCESGLEFKHTRRGLFWHTGFGLSGFSDYGLEELIWNSENYHPQSHSKTSLLCSMPLIALAKLQRRRRLDREEARIAARVLFGEDLQTLVEYFYRCSTEDKQHDLAPPLVNSEVKRKLSACYISCVAPAFAFLGPAAYLALGLNESEVSEILEAVSFVETPASFRAGRLNNELYLVGLHDHLDSYLHCALDAFCTVVNSHPKINDNDIRIELGLRGFIEHALIKGPAQLASILRHKSFSHIFSAYMEDNPHIIIRLETATVSTLPKYAVNHDEECRPGIIASLTWIIRRFFSGEDPSQKAVRTAGLRWIFSYFSHKATNLVNPRQDLEDLWYKLCTAYSTALQWSLDDSVDKEVIECVTLLRGKLESAAVSDSLHNVVKLIYFDEVIWASLEQGYTHNLSNAVKELEEVLSRAKLRASTCTEEHLSFALNLYFTLAWHNGWRQSQNDNRDDCYQHLRDIVKAWFNEWTDKAITQITHQPEVLKPNLQYHWMHFVTQRSCWLRERVFPSSEDDLSTDFTRVTRGSEGHLHLDTSKLNNCGQDYDNNEMIARIFKIIIDRKDLEPALLRNAIFMAGSRVTFMTESNRNSLRQAVNALLTKCDDEKKTTILCAVFELVRQGMVEPDSAYYSSELLYWIEHTLQRYSSNLQNAWTQYYKELDQLVCKLDPKPHDQKGWEDVIDELNLNIKSDPPQQ